MNEKSLVRKIKREKKAAMRELRKDSEFIDQQRFKESSAARQRQKALLKKTTAEFTQEVGTYRLHVKKGGELLKGGGSFVKAARAPKGSGRSY